MSGLGSSQAPFTLSITAAGRERSTIACALEVNKILYFLYFEVGVAVPPPPPPNISNPSPPMESAIPELKTLKV